MKYAIVRIDGKQLKIEEGETLRVNRQGKLNFDVLAYSDGKEILMGSPVLSDIRIKASVLSEGLGRKVQVRRFKAKSRYQKSKGHRQPISIIKIEGISKAGEKSETKAVEKEVAPKKTITKKTTAKKVTTPRKAKKE